jgi:hypothetical protein
MGHGAGKAHDQDKLIFGFPLLSDIETNGNDLTFALTKAAPPA